MGDFNRFVSYIYFYKSRRRVGNVGFAKLLVNDTFVKLNVNISNVASKNLDFKIYLFMNDGERIHLGEAVLKNNSITYSDTLEADKIGKKGRAFGESAGLIVANEGEKDDVFATIWMEYENEDIIFKSYEHSENEREEEYYNKVDLSEVIEEPESEASEVMAEYESDSKEEVMAESAGEVESVEVIEEPAGEEALSAQSVEVKYEEKPYDIMSEFEGRDVIDCFNDDEYMDCIEICPDDLEKFPEHIKRMKNNTFLMHGYMSFHHLLLARSGDKARTYLLGVPGTFRPTEQMMASMYGFNSFKNSHRSDMTLKCFGYWYIVVQV